MKLREKIAIVALAMLLSGARAARADTLYFAPGNSETDGSAIYEAPLTNGSLGTISEFATIPSGSDPHEMLIAGNYLFVGLDGGDTTLGEYSLSHTTPSPNIFPAESDISDPIGVAFSGGNLFVANYGGEVNEYAINGSTGGVTSVANEFWDPAAGLTGLAIVGNNLYASDSNGHIYEETMTGFGTGTPGTTLSSSLVSEPYGIAISPNGDDLFIANEAEIGGVYTIGEYDFVTGKYSTLVTGDDLNRPGYMAVDGSTLYVSNANTTSPGDGSITEYGLSLNSDGSSYSDPPTPFVAENLGLVYGIAIEPSLGSNPIPLPPVSGMTVALLGLVGMTGVWRAKGRSLAA